MFLLDLHLLITPLVPSHFSCRSLFVLCFVLVFSFGHLIVCLSSICDFSLTLWYHLFSVFYLPFLVPLSFFTPPFWRLSRFSLTLSDASLINCLAASLQMAGTVTTKNISFIVKLNLLCMNCFKKWSFKYRIDSQNTVKAGTSFPLMSCSIIFNEISWKWMKFKKKKKKKEEGKYDMFLLNGSIYYTNIQ